MPKDSEAERELEYLLLGHPRVIKLLYEALVGSSSHVGWLPALHEVLRRVSGRKRLESSPESELSLMIRLACLEGRHRKPVVVVRRPSEVGWCCPDCGVRWFESKVG